MAMLQLHDRLNPERLTFQESTEISSVAPYFDGSLITAKGGGFLDVYEKPEEVYAKYLMTN